VKCLLLPTWLQAEINHRKIVDAVLKPLGYAKAKGEKEMHQKILYNNEIINCSISVRAMWRIRQLYASMGYSCGEKEVDFRLLYWGAFHRLEGRDVDNMDAMMITTERIFRMVIENIGFLLVALERDCLDEWRKVLGHGERKN
jgi:hypothetical protein